MTPIDGRRQKVRVLTPMTILPPAQYSNETATCDQTDVVYPRHMESRSVGGGGDSFGFYCILGTDFALVAMSSNKKAERILLPLAVISDSIIPILLLILGILSICYESASTAVDVSCAKTLVKDNLKSRRPCSTPFTKRQPVAIAASDVSLFQANNCCAEDKK